MPQLDVVNIVSFIVVLSFLFYCIIFFFLSKLKTLLIIRYNILLQTNKRVFNSNYFLYLLKTIFNKQLFISHFKKFF